MTTNAEQAFLGSDGLILNFFEATGRGRNSLGAPPPWPLGTAPGTENVNL